MRKAIHEFIEHYHHERNHQGLDNRLIVEEESRADKAGAIQCRLRLGGMLNYYYRQAAEGTGKEFRNNRGDQTATRAERRLDPWREPAAWFSRAVGTSPGDVSSVK